MASIPQVDESRRRLVIGMLAGGVLIGSGCASRIVQLPANRSIYQLLGDVSINGVSATSETTINPGDQVITGERSYVIFVVGQESYILRSNSDMTVGGSRRGVELSRGKMLSVFAPGNPTNITTPTAVVSIRGTGVYVESESERSYVCTCYGTTSLSAPGNAAVSETIRSTHHSAPRYITNEGSSQSIQAAPFKNHDDEELLLIETLVGRSTPFIVPGGVNRSRRNYY